MKRALRPNLLKISRPNISVAQTRFEMFSNPRLIHGRKKQENLPWTNLTRTV